MTLDEIYEEFADLSDWEEQCEFLIELGRELPTCPAAERTEANRVHGCQSLVWLTTQMIHTPGRPPTMHIFADSDSMFVRGLIVILLAVYSGRTPAEILAADVQAVFHKLGLDRHLSSQRRNGLFGMVQRIRKLAQEQVDVP